MTMKKTWLPMNPRAFFETESETFGKEALYRTDDNNKPAEGWVTNADGTMGYCQNGYLLTGYQMIDDSRYLFFLMTA